ncbi:hypothetical protein QJN73_25750, partial [Escherichia coli]
RYSFASTGCKRLPPLLDIYNVKLNTLISLKDSVLAERFFGSFMHINSGMPYVYVKLPKNLSARTLSFKDIKVLSLTLYISN